MKESTKKLPSYNEMRLLISKMPKSLNQVQAYFAVSYACAARVGEVLRPDKSKNPNFEGVPSICRNDLKVKETDQGERLLINIRTEKQSNPDAQRIVPVSMNKRNSKKGLWGERWLADIILDFSNESKEEELFPFTTRWGHLKCWKYMGFNPHVFRKARATHLIQGEVTGKPMDIEYVKRIGGWSNLNILSRIYLEVTYMDISAQLG